MSKNAGTVKMPHSICYVQLGVLLIYIECAVVTERLRSLAEKRSKATRSSFALIIPWPLLCS